MTRGHPVRRLFRHLLTDRMAVRRALPKAARKRIEAAIADGERRHRGQVRFAVEAALPLTRVLRNAPPRERALEVFSALRIWDTAENCGVLVYLLMADRDVETHVGTAAWDGICRKMEKEFRAGRFTEGVETGIAEINVLLAKHFPRTGPEAGNELSDRPVIL
jgi:uncharacterized membrane protein